MTWFNTLYITALGWSWSLWKLVLHVVTKKSELERICTSTDTSSELVVRFEKSLHYSKVLGATLSLIETNPSTNVHDLARSVATAKKMNADSSDWSSVVLPTLTRCLQSVCAVSLLKHQLLRTAATKYDSSNRDHEALLAQLWALLRPHTERTGRITSQWSDIGFQGTDPATDFRAMGLLGLQQLIYFGQAFNVRAQAMVDECHKHPAGYPFACGGITVTSLCMDLLKSHDAVPYLLRNGATVENFAELYCLLFSSWHTYYYASHPASVMDFNPIFAKYKQQLLKSVQKRKFVGSYQS